MKNHTILAHYYQNDAVFNRADVTGDSYQLSIAASKTETPWIVFCGVRFMAETARILCRPDQRVVVPDGAAGCPMADMIDAASFVSAFELVRDTIGEEPVPLVYVNTTAEVKAAAGARGGIACTSSNAAPIMKNILASEKKVFFAPDVNLALNTAKTLGIWKDKTCIVKTTSTSSMIRNDARVFAWDGFCSVHTRFSASDVRLARQRQPGCMVLVHPECNPEVVEASDYTGSTSQLLATFYKVPPGTRLVIGTEFNFVNRLANLRSDVSISALRHSSCLNMAKTAIDKLDELLVALNNDLARTESRPSFEEIKVPTDVIANSKVLLERMIASTSS